jgi:DNA-binding beta-propeller fold protein YncE
MLHRHTDNPLYRILVVASLMVLMAVIADPRLRPWGGRIDAQQARAVGGYTAVEVLGQSDFTHNLSGLSIASMSMPQSVALDSTNNRLFVADTINSRVLAYDLDSNNDLLDGVPDYVIGQPDFDTSTSNTTVDGLNNPTGVAVVNYCDETYLYVADSYNQRVLQYSVNTLDQFSEDAVDVYGQAGDFSTAGSGNLADELNYPVAVSALTDGDYVWIAIADRDNHRVIVHALELNNVEGCAVIGDTTYVIGQDAFGEGGYGHGTGTADEFGFNEPYGVELYSGTPHLAVTDARWNRVLDFDVSILNLDAQADGTSDSILMEADSVLGQLDFISTDPNVGVGDANAAGLVTDWNVCDSPSTNMDASYDSDNNRLFVPDYCNRRVVVYDLSDGITDGEDAIDVVAQDDFITVNIGVSEELIGYAEGVLYLNGKDQLYVADAWNNRVLLFDLAPGATPTPTSTPSGTFSHTATTLLGQFDSGDLVFTSSLSNGYEGLRRTQRVIDVVVDDVNNLLYVLEYSRVLVYQLDGSHQLLDADADFVLGQADFFSRDTAASQTTITSGSGLALDSTSNRLFVADGLSNRILVFDVATITDGEPAINVLGQTDFVTTDGGTTASSMYLFIGGLALDETGQRLFVADWSNNRVLVFDVAAISDGEPAVNVLGSPNFTTGTSALTASRTNGPTRLEFDETGQRLFVADNLNHRVLVFDVAVISNGEAAVNVLGQENFVTATDMSGTADGMTRPTGLAFDDDGDRLFVYEPGSMRFMVFDVAAISNGEDAVNVLGQSDFASTGYRYGPSAFLASSVGDRAFAAYDAAAGYLYAGMEFQPALSVFDVASITDGEPVVGYISGVNASGFSTTADVALDEAYNRLFVSDQDNNRVLMFNLDDQHQPLDAIADAVLGQSDFDMPFPGVSSASFWVPTGLAFDGIANRLYVTDYNNHRVLVFDTAAIGNGEPAVAVLGQSDYTTRSHTLSQDGLYYPNAVDVDTAEARLFIADAGNYRVLVHDIATIASGQNASIVLGQPDFLTATPNTTQDGMQWLTGISYDAANSRLFVVDTYNNRVLVFDGTAPTNGMAATYVLGQENFTSAVTGADLDTFQDTPNGVAYSAADDKLYVTDRGAHRVIVFDVATIDDGEDAVDIYGQTDELAVNAGVTNTAFNGPNGLEFDDASGTLYVADGWNNRVLIFGPEEEQPSGGGGSPGITPIGFYPDRITVNNDEPEVGDKNVLVNIYANFSDSFEGTVDVLLSNEPDFETFVPFRYNIPDSRARAQWPKTVAWDLCLGLPKSQPCEPGTKTVYARFYVNVTPPIPQFITNNP